VRSVAIFGSTEVDFRQAQLPEGVTEVAQFSLFGANNLIVTSDMSVTVTGLSLLGKRTMRRSPAKQMPSLTAKSLRVSGTSIMGRLSIKDMP
jgi:predicted membrane protein